MTVNVKTSAWTLIVGAIAFVALMAVHPDHTGGAILGPLSLSAIVHGTAFVAQPLLVYGFWVLTRDMGERPMAQIALVFYVLSAALTMMAATMSALVIPAIVEAARGPQVGPHSVEPASYQMLANYTVMLNRAFASLHVGLASIAILLWSLAWPSHAPLALLTRLFGALVGVGVIGWALSGTMTLEARHGALLVTLAHQAWTLLAAMTLLRQSSNMRS